MSDKHSDKVVTLPVPPAQTARDTAVERVLDAMDYLRSEMRRTGMDELAVILDEAFALSLRTYVARQYERLRDVPNSAGGAG